MKVVAHRGWPARFPDNVLAGFVAVSSVADVVEMDVRRARDGKLVLAHDPELGGHLVSATPSTVLVELVLGDGHHPALLDEVLAALPDTPAQLEVKNLPFQPGYEPDQRLALEVAERARPDDLVTSFNPLAVAAVRRVFPQVKTGLAVSARANLQDAIGICREAGHAALISAESLVTGQIEIGDLEIYPWTVNDPTRAGELAEFGVSGIITDDAPRLAEAIGSDT